MPSDYIIERLIKDGMLAKMDFEKMPNAKANLLDNMWTADYDVGNLYSVPYMWGTVGILYNTEYVDEEITSWASLFDPQYKRDVFMLDSIRDTMGVTLKYLGYNLNERSEEALGKVRDLLIKQKQDGIVQGYLTAIDSATLMNHYGATLHPVEGPIENIKITTASDFYMARAILDARENSQIFGL